MGNPFAGMRFRLSANPGPISVADYQGLAKRRLPASVYAFIAGDADDLRAMHGNTAAFARWALTSRVLTGNAGTDLVVRVGGAELSLPVYLSPAGMIGAAHWTGELAAAQAAEQAGTRAVISTASTYTPEEIAGGTQTRHFFQLYPWSDSASGGRELTDRLIRRASAAGFETLFVTVDVPVIGNREGERRQGWELTPTLSPRHLLQGALKPAWSVNFLRRQRVAARMLLDESRPARAVDAVQKQASLMRPELSWDDFAWMRERWSGPLYIKGVLHPADAARAVDLGADGVVVSNHGGRQLGEAQASFDALGAVVDEVDGKVPVLLDGGIRRGSDVVKALCMGATAVGIGRPYVYGLAARGGVGVRHVLEILRAEMIRTMQLMGVGSVADLHRSMLLPADPRPA